MWSRKPKTHADFWARANKQGPIVSPALGRCWLWTGVTDTRRYPCGQVRIKNKLWRVPRYAWTIVYGLIPKGLRVLHRCDNGLCFRPKHLFLGTAKDNTQDMIAKGRAHFHFRDGQ